MEQEAILTPDIVDTNEMDNYIESKYKNQVIAVSNSMIRARETTNLLESKIQVLAIHYMNKNDMGQKEKEDQYGNQYKVNFVILKANEIRKLMDRKDGMAYDEIRVVANNMKNSKLIIEDKEKHSFFMRSLYSDIGYDSGNLYIEFEPSMERYFMGLKNNFTKLNLQILFSYKKNGGFQLYWLLKSYTYPPNLKPIDMNLSQEELPVIRITWNVTDLRMEMGYVDLNQPMLQREGSKKNPNWEKMAKEEKHPQYKRWIDFKRRVIEPGVEEINRISDIYICDVEKELVGKGGKVNSLTFVVQHNKEYYEKNRDQIPSPEGLPQNELFNNGENFKMSEEQLDDFLDQMRDIFQENIKTRDLKKIAEEAGYNLERIQKMYDLSKRSGPIQNLTGWMLSALKNDFNDPVQTQNTKPRKKKEANFIQRDYDDKEMADLEKMVLENSKRRFQEMSDKMSAWDV